LVDDLDRKIKKGHDRLDVLDDKAEIALTPENAERVQNISNKIQTLLAQIEQFGEDGKVAESQQLMLVVDKLKEEKEQVINSNDTRLMSSTEKRMKVCDVCGAFLVVGDTEKRMQSHLDGKQHQGFALIRRTISEYKKLHKDDPAYDSDKERKGGRGDRGGDRGDRGGDRDRYRDKDRYPRDDRYSRSGDKRDSYYRDDRDKKRSRDSY